MLRFLSEGLPGHALAGTAAFLRQAAGGASTSAAYSTGYAAGTVAASAPPPVAGAVVAPVSYAVGVNYAALPAGAMAVAKNGVNYYLSGNTWFKPAYGANGVYYTVVPTP